MTNDSRKNKLKRIETMRAEHGGDAWDIPSQIAAEIGLDAYTNNALDLIEQRLSDLTGDIQTDNTKPASQMEFDW